MFPTYPVAPKQPRRVRSGDRAPIRDNTTHGAHRVSSGQRRPVGPTAPEGPIRRPGARRKVPPAYATRRS